MKKSQYHELIIQTQKICLRSFKKCFKDEICIYCTLFNGHRNTCYYRKYLAQSIPKP
uniref:Uncharacterized protein n=1 Tax=Anguilla anguilla TaxID=7936 RepID=A0A0E9QBQ6_ANGAN